MHYNNFHNLIWRPAVVRAFADGAIPFEPTIHDYADVFVMPTFGRESTLGEYDAEPEEHVTLLLGLDAFGHKAGTDRLGELDQHPHQSLATGVFDHSPDDSYVELDDIGLEFKDVAKAGESGSGVVDGQQGTCRTQGQESPDGGVVVDGDVFGQFERHALPLDILVGPSRLQDLGDGFGLAPRSPVIRQSRRRLVRHAQSE